MGTAGRLANRNPALAIYTFHKGRKVRPLPKDAISTMWQVASHINTAVSMNSSTNTCTPKQMGETGSFPPQIRVLTCGPYEVILHRPRQWETFKTQLQRETMAQKRKTSSCGSQYVFSYFILPRVPLESVSQMRGECCTYFISTHYCNSDYNGYA